MEKITKKALELAGFKNADQIALILSHVPNPQVGLEILLGIHEPLDVDIHPMKYFKYEHDDIIYRIDSIDELGAKIHLSKYRQKTDTVYFLTEDDKKNNVFVQYDRPCNYHSSKSIFIDGYYEEKVNMELSFLNGNSYKTITEEKFYSFLAKWDPNVFAEAEVEKML